MKLAFRTLRNQLPGRRINATKLIIPAVLGLAVLAIATPPVGFVLNQILAKGTYLDNINENVQVTRDQDGTVRPWGAEMQTHGATDFYVQHLVLAPGGYSGWHIHPGILVGTVTSGSIDFYNAQCEKHTVNAGEVYFEDGNVHGIANTGAVNADLSIAYLIKQGAPRRLEADAPTCAATTPIP
ncbi:MAG: cupin domain-containing protein [Acidobacteria bacterium]|nr:cupin domain-containing protein [Acidobacteriota bacterium]